MYLGQNIKQILPGNVAVGGANMGMVPLFSVQWCPSRAAIWAGYVAADGQELDDNLFPDAAAGIAANNVPTTSGSNWLADPAARGAYVAGSSAGKFRVPDYNGKSSGSLGAVFLRGDGTLSAAIAGAIQQDAMQGHWHGPRPGTALAGSPGNWNGAGGGTNGNYNIGRTGNPVTDGTNGTPRTASETRPLNVTGCWVIKLFGAVTNVGSADAAQLASSYANLAGRIPSFEGGIKQMPELLWSGSVGSNGVVLTLSRPLVTGDMVWLQHSDVSKYQSHPIVLTQELLTGGRNVNFSFGGGGATGFIITNTSQFTTNGFTSGYPVEKIYASRAKN